MAKKKKSTLAAMGIPELNLYVENYVHEVPEHLKLDMYVEWKLKDAPREIVGPLKAFAIEDGELKVVNRNIDVIWRFPVKEIKRAYMLPCEGQ